jgi:ABC-type glycerol-3-phosphate transport system substrate-binding protein
MKAQKNYGFISVFCVFLLAVSVSVYGGGNSDSGKTSASSPAGSGPLQAEPGAEIEFVYWEGSTADKRGFDFLIEQFGKDHPEIKLKPQVYPSGTFRDQLDTRIAANDWPDVMRYTYQRLGKFKEAGVMLDLTGRIPEESLSDLVPAFRSALTHEGRLVGMPHHTDTIAIFYNKRMFAESGIRIPKDAQDGWTWEELNQIAAKLKADHKLDYAFSGIWDNGSGYRFLPFVYAAGGAILSEDQSAITINSPDVLKAISLYEGWRRNNLVIKNGFTQTSQANRLFVAQQIAFTFSGSWHASYMQENMPDNWGVTYMPKINGKTGSDMGGNGLFGYKKTKYPNAAAIFIDYVASKDIVRRFCEISNFIPVRQSLIREGINYSSYQREMQTFLDIVSTIDPRMAADETSTRFQQFNVIFSEEMDPLVIDGSATARQVLEKAERRMKAALAE